MNTSARHKLTFALKFLALLLLFYVVVAVNPVNDHVVVPFTAAITRVFSALVQFFENDVAVSGTTIASTRFAMDVKNGCNAVETMMLFAAAVIAFPAALRFRILGLALGLPLIQLVNLVRLTSLFWVGTRHPDWFSIFHIALWQVGVILFGVAIFGAWCSKFAVRSTADVR